MFSHTPRSDLFRLTLPDTFYIKSISDKYNKWINRDPVVIRSIEELVNESIQGFDTPQYGTTLIEQTFNSGDGISNINYQLPLESDQKLIEKVFQITFRHTVGFITYYYLLEHLFAYYAMGPGNETKRKPFGTVIHESMLPTGQIVCKSTYKQCFMTGMDGISNRYDTVSRDNTTFNVTFGYNIFGTSFNLPEVVIKE